MTTYVDAGAAVNFPSETETGAIAINADGGALPVNFVLPWLERDSFPRMLIGDDLSVRWSNAAARAFLREDPDISLTGDLLHFGNKANEERFACFIASVVASGSLYLRWEDRDDFLLVRAERLPASFEGTVVAVTMNSRRWATSSLRFDDLEIAFGLTPREVEIVTLLAQGINVAGICVQVDCAIETVRRHVKNIYLKVGVSTREELLNRLHPFRW